MNKPTPEETLAFMNFVIKHGGPRTPGPGKKLGRPKKPAKDRAVTTTIVLSSRKAAQALKRQARKAKLTPGALIERELRL